MAFGPILAVVGSMKKKSSSLPVFSSRSHLTIESEEAMGKKKTIIALWITWQSCFSAPRPDAADAGGVGIVLNKGYVFIEARINGAGPFRMMLDTGADSC